MRNSILDTLYVVQKVIDSAIPAGCLISVVLVALRIIAPPESVSTAFGDPTYAWLWALTSFISYVAIIIGTWIRGKSGPNGVPSKDTYLFFEYPGLITASFSTTVYGIAALATFGFASAVPAGFAISIGIYFLARWLRTRYTIKAARLNVLIANRG